MNTLSALGQSKTKILILVILTQTIGCTTDHILINDVGTQTARPKTSLSFATFPYKSRTESNPVYGSVDNNILRNARSLRTQMDDIKRLEEQLRKKRDPVGEDDKTTSESNKEITDDSRELEFSDDSLSDNGKTDFGCRSSQHSNDSDDILTNDGQENFLNAPTLTSWAGFDSGDEDDYDLPELPKKTISEGYAPWRNFKDILIGNR